MDWVIKESESMDCLKREMDWCFKATRLWIG